MDRAHASRAAILHSARRFCGFTRWTGGRTGRVSRRLSNLSALSRIARPRSVDYSEEVAERLRKERTREKKEEEFERLRVRYDVRLNPEGEAILLQSLDRPLTTDELNHPFYAYEGGTISVAEGLGSLQAVGAQGVLQDQAQAAERIGRLLLPVRLFEAEARQRGWTEEAAFVEWREHQRRALILNQLFQQATAGAASSEDEIRAHYEAHKDRYRTQEAVVVHELWTAEEEDAAALRAEWEAGAPIADLLDRPGVRSHAGVEGHGVREHGWEMRLLRLYEPRYPELVKAAFAAEVGALVGPLESMDGYGCSGCCGGKAARSSPLPRRAAGQPLACAASGKTNGSARLSASCRISTKTKSPSWWIGSGYSQRAAATLTALDFGPT